MPLPALRLRLAQRRRSRAGARWPYQLPDLETPPPATGERTGPPTYVGVGVQKAGTTWWHALIADHPGVHAPSALPKELHFFDRYWEAAFDDADVQRYHRWFSRPQGQAVGEWCPRYLHDFWTPALLARAAPEARLLVLLRDPVERYRSGLTHDASRKAPPVPLPADDAFARGLYAGQLRRLYLHFPSEQVLVLQYEQCCADPATQLARTYRFLGLDPDHRPGFLSEVMGSTIAVKSSLATGIERTLRDGYRDDMEDLLSLVPDLDLTLWTSVDA